MPSRIISIPIVAYLIWNIYLSVGTNEVHAMGMIIPAVLLGAVFVLSPQVDWWWYRRFPPDLDAGLQRMLTASAGPYRSWTPEEQEGFRKKTVLFRMNVSCKGAAFDDEIPDDVRVIVAACGVLLTRKLDDFLLPGFQVVVINPAPFLSPQYPGHLHISELYEEDHVLLFSIQHLMMGFMDPLRYYNIGLHEWARAVVLSYPEREWPEMRDDTWNQLEQISGFSRSGLVGYVNRPDLELLPAAIVHYIHFPEAFRAILPEEASRLRAILGY